MKSAAMPPQAGAKDMEAGQADVDHGARILELETAAKANPEDVQAWVALGQRLF